MKILTESTQQISFLVDDNVGVIEIDYPPVNALSQSVRQGIVDGIMLFNRLENVDAIVIRCKQRTFIAGADIKEFGLPPTEPYLPQVVNQIEQSEKPVVACLFGTSLGGGFEVALACHYRVAASQAKVGLPEVNLGLIPGAGGTQRLPKIVGVQKAVEMITEGKHYSVEHFKDMALFDLIVEDLESLNQQTIDWIKSQIQSGELKPKKVSDFSPEVESIDWTELEASVVKKAKGRLAPLHALKVIAKTYNMPVEQGMPIERETFLRLRESEESAALRYVFAAEGKAGKVSLTEQGLTIKKVGVVGGGNMGSGIATALLNAHYPVVLIEQSSSALDAGKARITANIEGAVKVGKMSQEMADKTLANLETSTEYQSLANCDLVVEAIFEDIEIKKTLLSTLDAVVNQQCIFATNTSYLDIDEMASVLKDPSRLVGMHFFSPAHIMKLLEVVKAAKTSDVALATALEVGKQLKKMTVMVGVCFGFAGNRMYTRYGREVQQMLLEGARIEQIDNALTHWGMAMGPLAVQDLSGIDIGHKARSAQPFPAHDAGYFRAAATMVEHGRLGRKTEKGFYQYQAGKMLVDPDAAALIADQAKLLGIGSKTFTEQEIVERALMALIVEGLQLMAAGIVQRLSDIDVIWLHGYGFPRHKGGPMFQAKQLGTEQLQQRLRNYQNVAGDKIWPNVDFSLLETL